MRQPTNDIASQTMIIKTVFTHSTFIHLFLLFHSKAIQETGTFTFTCHAMQDMTFSATSLLFRNYFWIYRVKVSHIVFESVSPYPTQGNTYTNKFNLGRKKKCTSTAIKILQSYVELNSNEPHIISNAYNYTKRSIQINN